jgi:hypothetical protein
MVLVSLLIASPFVHPLYGDSQNTRREFEMIYKRIAEADNSRDYDKIEAAFISLLSPDFTMRTLEGTTIDVKHEIDNVKSNLKGSLSNEVEFEIVCVSGTEDEVSATLVWKNSGIVKDAGGKASRIDQGVIARDDWTRTNVGWRLKHTELLKQIYLFVDGKTK